MYSRSYCPNTNIMQRKHCHLDSQAAIQSVANYIRPENDAKNIVKGMGGSPGELGEELVTQETRKKGQGMNCDVGEATEGLDNEL